jgi:hypothetical protein
VAVLFDLSWAMFEIAELYVYSTQLGALILNLNVFIVNVRDQEM